MALKKFQFLCFTDDGVAGTDDRDAALTMVEEGTEVVELTPDGPGLLNDEGVLSEIEAL